MSKKTQQITPIENFISTFLTYLDPRVSDNVKGIVVAAIAHGAFSAIDAIVNGYPSETGERLPVTAISLTDEASEVLQSIFQSEDEEDEDGEEDDEEEDDEEEDDEEEDDEEEDDEEEEGEEDEDILDVDAELKTLAEDEVKEAQADLDEQLDPKGNAPKRGWTKLTKGKAN